MRYFVLVVVLFTATAQANKRCTFVAQAAANRPAVPVTVERALRSRLSDAELARLEAGFNSVMQATGSFHQPKKVIIKVGPKPQVRVERDQIVIYAPLEYLRDPARLPAILHEFAHGIWEETRRHETTEGLLLQMIYVSMDNSKRLFATPSYAYEARKAEREKQRGGAQVTGARIEVAPPVPQPKYKRDGEEVTATYLLMKAYEELFADLTTIAATGDPQVIAKTTDRRDRNWYLMRVRDYSGTIPQLDTIRREQVQKEFLDAGYAEYHTLLIDAGQHAWKRYLSQLNTATDRALWFRYVHRAMLRQLEVELESHRKNGTKIDLAQLNERLIKAIDDEMASRTSDHQ